MSSLLLLGEARFRVEASALPHEEPRWPVFQIDESALVVADVMVRKLQSIGVRTSAPKREGRGGVWFLCHLGNCDVGVSVAIESRVGGKILVYTVACERPKTCEGGAEGISWLNAREAILYAIRERFGDAGLEWQGEPFLSPHKTSEKASGQAAEPPAMT